ncbi:MAG: hypothetical protein NW200_09795 [Hyphomonadaceae bacterium]|nr:hypothetical protein [Hyphomonadaceae bacterium]
MPRFVIAGCAALVIVLLALAVAPVGRTQVTARADPNAICPISDDNVEKAVKAFNEMTAVLKDQRCVNCHGAVNPYAQGGRHIGGVISLEHGLSGFLNNPDAIAGALKGADGGPPSAAQIKDAGDAIRTIFNAEPPMTDAATIAEVLELGGIEDLATGVCMECHQHTPVHWRVAKSSFAGKSQEDLCAMFQEKMDPSEFLGHVTSDGSNFVQVGFAGTRGLTEFGRGVLKAETGRNYVREPVRSMGPDAFIDASNRWVDALGARFRKPPDCGCKNTRYVLTGTVRFNVDMSDRRGSGSTTSVQTIEAPMRFVREGEFEAVATSRFVQTTAFEGRGGNCKLEQPHIETWTFKGKVDERSGQITQKVSVREVTEPAAMVCQAGGRVIRMPTPETETETDLSEYDFTMPARVDETKRLSFPFAHGSREVELTVVKR